MIEIYSFNPLQLNNNIRTTLHIVPRCTYNCSMREKKELVPPLFIAEAKIARPSEEEKEIAVEGNTLR